MWHLCRPLLILYFPLLVFPLVIFSLVIFLSFFLRWPPFLFLWRIHLNWFRWEELRRFNLIEFPCLFFLLLFTFFFIFLVFITLFITSFFWIIFRSTHSPFLFCFSLFSAFIFSLFSPFSLFLALLFLSPFTRTDHYILLALEPSIWMASLTSCSCNTCRTSYSSIMA